MTKSKLAFLSAMGIFGTIGIFSYLDPVIAVILSSLLLQEKITLWGVVGTVLILGSALYSELPERN